MKKNKIAALFLAAIVTLSMSGCSKSSDSASSSPDGNLNSTLGQEEDVEVTEATVHMNAVEASTTGNWEAMFVPIDAPGRAIDYANVDLTPTAEELAAMEKEPAYGKPFFYYMSDGCTSGPTVANHLGFYEEAGLIAEGIKGTSDVEALGTKQATVAVGHIAKMLVPITNGVDITFVGGAHIGCKSIYVLADSEYNSTQDLKGTQVSVPGGIGAADYNITALLLDADGINPQTEVEMIQVSADACVAAMERGEISAALLSDAFAYGMVKDGKLRCIRSLLDTDFATQNCCVIAMNRTFTQENPVISKKIVQAIQKAHSYMRENPEEATNMLLKEGWNSGDYEMNVMLNNSLQFGLSQETTQTTLKDIVDKYIRLQLIQSMDNSDEVMKLAWTPLL